MRTIAVIARKGGSGKTTVATNLAIAAHRRGLKTVLADSDRQRSAVDVLKGRRQGDGPTIVETESRGLFQLQVSSLRAGVEALVIDTPAGEEDELAHAIVLADVSVLVVRPTLLDFAALIRTLRVIRHLRKRALVVLNQAPPKRAGVEPPAVRKAQEALRLLRLPVSPAILRTRAAYQSALERGCSAEEQTGDVAAAIEIGDLWLSVQQFAADVSPPEYVSDHIINDRALF
ncbi:MAG TPA: AAA family ATPase [Caulobacteraceae bacterium]|nr:AAA family ATPase [Caulobacteraceae bacterium]